MRALGRGKLFGITFTLPHFSIPHALMLVILIFSLTESTFPLSLSIPPSEHCHPQKIFDFPERLTLFRFNFSFNSGSGYMPDHSCNGLLSLDGCT